MTVWEVFYQGRYLVKRTKKLWFLLWLTNAMMAAVATLPIFGALNSELKNSLMEGSMLERFDLNFASETLYKYWDALPMLLWLTLAVGTVYIVLTLLTAGGILTVFSSSERRFTAPVFFKGCGTYFWRFFRLFLTALIFYGIFVLVLNGVLTSLVNKLTKSWTQERYVMLASWTRLLVVAFVFLLVNMVFDYAKVRLVIEESRSAIMATFRSIKFVLDHFRKTLALFLLCLGLGLIIIAIYNPLEQVLPQNTRRWIIAVFALQQLFIIARIYVRLTFFSSEILLYESFRTSPEVFQEGAGGASTPVVKPQVSTTELRSPEGGPAVDPAI